MRNRTIKKKIGKINLGNCVLLSLLLFTVFSMGYRIHSAGSLAAKTESLENLTKKKDALEKELALLEYEDSKYSSLKYIESEAQKLGLIKASEPIIAVDISVGAPLASAR